MVTCEVYSSFFESSSLKVMNACLNGETHGPVHILIGGEWGASEEAFVQKVGEICRKSACFTMWQATRRIGLCRPLSMGRRVNENIWSRHAGGSKADISARQPHTSTFARPSMRVISGACAVFKCYLGIIANLPEKNVLNISVSNGRLMSQKASVGSPLSPLSSWWLLFLSCPCTRCAVGLPGSSRYAESLPLVTKYLWRKGYLRIPDTCTVGGDDCITKCPSNLYEAKGMTPYDVLMDVHALTWMAHTTQGTLVRRFIFGFPSPGGSHSSQRPSNTSFFGFCSLATMRSLSYPNSE